MPVCHSTLSSPSSFVPLTLTSFHTYSQVNIRLPREIHLLPSSPVFLIHTENPYSQVNIRLPREIQPFTLPPSSPVFLIHIENPPTMANLVSGAAYHGRKTLPPLIPSRTIPDIHQDAIILGVCGVQATQQSLEVDGDGWFMSDFFAFNYLLKDQGLQQVWIAADSEHSFLDFFKDHPQHEPGFLHGNPCNERKVVFSKGLVEQGSLTPLTVCMLPTKDLILLCLTCSRSTPPETSAKLSSMLSDPRASLPRSRRPLAPSSYLSSATALPI